jgi:hypothetical protein
VRSPGKNDGHCRHDDTDFRESVAAQRHGLCNDHHADGRPANDAEDDSGTELVRVELMLVSA